MSEALTKADLQEVISGLRLDFKQDLLATETRLEKKISYFFDRFEEHFDDTMGSIQTSLIELREELRGEHRHDVNVLREAITVHATKTGHHNLVAPILESIG